LAPELVPTKADGLLSVTSESCAGSGGSGDGACCQKGVGRPSCAGHWPPSSLGFHHEKRLQWSV